MALTGCNTQIAFTVRSRESRQSDSDINQQACRVSNRLRTVRIGAIRSTIYPHSAIGGPVARIRQFVTLFFFVECHTKNTRYGDVSFVPFLLLNIFDVSMSN